MTALLAQEVDAPDGVKPVVWRLLTNRPVETLEAAAELIDWYRCRWEIEIFFDEYLRGQTTNIARRLYSWSVP